MLLYVLCIIQSGPLRLFSAMRGEAKHQALKNIAKCTRSRKNILHTIAFREQINLCCRLNSDNFLKDNIDYGSCNEFQKKNFDDALIQCIPEEFSNDSVETDWLYINGLKYREGSIVLSDVPDGELPVFGVIESIIKKEEDFYVLFRNLETIEFNDDVFAYEVKDGDRYSFKSLKEMYRSETFVAAELTDGKTYIVVDTLI